jgi:hypothetical protein
MQSKAKKKQTHTNEEGADDTEASTMNHPTPDVGGGNKNRRRKNNQPNKRRRTTPTTGGGEKKPAGGIVLGRSLPSPSPILLDCSKQAEITTTSALRNCTGKEAGLVSAR